MNFGKWIFVSFVAFAAFIGTLATICIRQDVPLVSKEYYKEEIAYQEQIQRIENTNSLSEKPSIFFEKNYLTIQYNGLSFIENAQLKLIRPSDENLDQQFVVHAGQGSTQSFQLTHAVPGMYRVKLTWEQEGRGYFLEKVIIL